MTANVPIDLARVARDVDLPLRAVEATMELLDAGSTVPFITRYRRDQTGGLDEQQIERIRQAVARLRHLEERRGTILRSIESQNKLTDELRSTISSARSVKHLEDIYLPYRPKKQSLATRAREQGLEPLAREILAEDPLCAELDARGADFVNPDREVPDAATALLGAGRIIAEGWSEQADFRQRVRKLYHKSAFLVSKKITDDQKKTRQYQDFLDYHERLSRVPHHRVLAINRGEKAEVLRVHVEVDTQAIEQLAIEMLVPAEHRHREFLLGCTKDALERLVLPSLEREARRELTEHADAHAVTVFARNLRNLLLQAPLPNRRVLAIDPGFKAGCKLAALDEMGRVLDQGVVYLVGSDEKKAAARTKIAELVTSQNLDVIAVGNGTACRQTEELVAEMIAGELAERNVQYVVVNEAGASVYSTSEIGREELPAFDPMQRSAVSIGRRLQDPLSEFVKIDPASIGVGLYQHDARSKHLRDTLDDVVQSCVSFVGVDLNSASAPLLRYVSGMNQLTARRVYEYRQEHGPFRTRQQLLEVSGIGEATFEQAAGFLKIADGDNPFDGTWIHPENYPAAEQLLNKLELEPAAVKQKDAAAELRTRAASLDRDALTGELEVGSFTLEQILEAMTRPGRDPRADLPPPIFRRDVVRFEQLEIGMELRGTVLNVVDFGAFVDAGLSDSGLVHISQLSNGYVRDPHEVVAVGDQVRVWVTSLDKERRRVALTMIEPGTERPPEAKKPRSRRGKRARQPAAVGAEAGQAPAADQQTQTSDGRPPGRRGRREEGRGRRQDGRRSDRGRRDRRRSDGPPPQRGAYEKRAEKVVAPITKEMEEGKEFMRTFSDLLQFHQKQQQPEEAEQEPPAKKTPAKKAAEKGGADSANGSDSSDVAEKPKESAE